MHMALVRTSIYHTIEVQTHGADFFLDVLCRLFDDVYSICRVKHYAPPTQITIQSDNTVTQEKISDTVVFLSTLVAKGIASVVLMNFLVVGHTHEDIDQLFSMILTRVLRRHRFQIPSDLLKLTQTEMQPHFEAKGEILRTAMLDYT